MQHIQWHQVHRCDIVDQDLFKTIEDVFPDTSSVITSHHSRSNEEEIWQGIHEQGSQVEEGLLCPSKRSATQEERKKEKAVP